MKLAAIQLYLLKDHIAIYKVQTTVIVYLPAVQRVQLVAPPLVPLVEEPGSHSVQEDDPVALL